MQTWDSTNRDDIDALMMAAWVAAVRIYEQGTSQTLLFFDKTMNAFRDEYDHVAAQFKLPESAIQRFLFREVYLAEAQTMLRLLDFQAQKPNYALHADRHDVLHRIEHAALTEQNYEQAREDRRLYEAIQAELMLRLRRILLRGVVDPTPNQKNRQLQALLDYYQHPAGSVELRQMLTKAFRSPTLAHKQWAFEQVANLEHIELPEHEPGVSPYDLPCEVCGDPTDMYCYCAKCDHTTIPF